MVAIEDQEKENLFENVCGVEFSDLSEWKHPRESLHRNTLISYQRDKLLSGADFPLGIKILPIFGLIMESRNVLPILMFQMTNQTLSMTASYFW
ncbi:uncharacterized protein OGAPODRAFT_15484 [Ogataea polymorpha]|uniref:uncharacterized protein n=1 Tax=Ogataea polymorpha TaxID=460523 RepID=UPI0007F408E6|nr:uncharacterized protein OGAPODRAFT_15484 [Ogataea polymorpha]OBA18913.1 hypothetical protein OGAPODRAFT_15484 [Ogataea polymorpha]